MKIYDAARRIRRKLGPKPKTRSVKPMGTGTTFSRYTERARYSNFRKKVDKVSPLQQQLFTYGQRVTWAYSAQGYTTFPVVRASDLTSLMNNVPSFADDTMILVRKTQQEILFSNQSNANCYVTLYNYRYRKDSTKSIRELIDAGFADSNFTGTVPTIATYGMSPYMSSNTMKTYIRFTGITRIELAAGKTHKHISTYNVNRYCNNEMLTAETPDEYLGGWTRGVFMLCSGEPVNDVTNKTSAYVVPSSGAIDVVVRERNTFNYGTPNSYKIEYLNTLPTTGITENIMEAATDESSTVEYA